MLVAQHCVNPALDFRPLQEDHLLLVGLSDAADAGVGLVERLE
jgi:hypothetical protein